MYTKVTISGQICTGKTTLFWDLYKQLKWPTFSASHFFRDYARIHHVSLQKGEEQEGNLTKVIDYGMQELVKKEQHVILEGWMAGVMADRIPGVLKVLLTCDENERVRRFAERENVSFEEARAKIKEREESVYRKLKENYGRDDILDPKKYDLVIDTTDRQAQEVLNLVLKRLNS